MKSQSTCNRYEALTHSRCAGNSEYITHVPRVGGMYVFIWTSHMYLHVHVWVTCNAMCNVLSVGLVYHVWVACIPTLIDFVAFTD